MKSGTLEDWKTTHKLALRTELGTGSVRIGGREIPLSISINIDGKAFFVEFPNSIKVTYHTKDIVEDAIRQYKKYLKKNCRIGGETK